MPKFIAIGYGDRAGYDRTPAPLREAAHAHDKALRQRGVMMGIAGHPVQIRNHENRNVEQQAGPYMASQLPVAGFTVIEATSLAEAVEMMSATPCAVAHGVVEVWPLEL
jgi:hypothetical protein